MRRLDVERRVSDQRYTPSALCAGDREFCRGLRAWAPSRQTLQTGSIGECRHATACPIRVRLPVASASTAPRRRSFLRALAARPEHNFSRRSGTASPEVYFLCGVHHFRQDFQGVGIGNACNAQHGRENHVVQHAVYRDALRCGRDARDLEDGGFERSAMMQACPASERRCRRYRENKWGAQLSRVSAEATATRIPRIVSSESDKFSVGLIQTACSEDAATES